MAAHKRIVLLGPTGVDKAIAMRRLSSYISDRFGQSLRFVDFERDFLKPHMLQHDIRYWTSFLSSDVRRQAHVWKSAWQQFEKTLDGEITVLGLHATYVSGIVGLRCPINLPRICEDFRPSLVVTLIDDIPAMWRRTEMRADGREIAGRPTFEQLQSSRRAEQILGDMIVTHSGDRAVRHVVCASGNTLSGLANLVIHNGDVVYLSFPISVPREMQRDRGDSTFINLLNEAHRLAAAAMKDGKRMFISPLAIDELPILSRITGATGGANHIRYDCATDRWRLDDLWGGEEFAIVPSLYGEFEFPLGQIRVASGGIRTDVGWRDRRLVLQAQSLAIICPKDLDEDRITRGVEEEIVTATTAQIPCFYWQKPEWDPENFLGTRFQSAGSMGAGYGQILFQRTDSLSALIAAKP